MHHPTSNEHTPSAESAPPGAESSPTAPGSWTSPLSARDLAAGATRLSSLQSDRGQLGWLEGRPANGGAVTIVLRSADGAVTDASPPTFNTRSLVHEYGGGAWLLDDGIIASSLDDQRLWHLGPDASAPLTAPPPTARGHRYAEPSPIAGTPWILYVRERHSDVAHAEPINEIVAVHRRSGAVEVMASGADFYASPCADPSGKVLAFVSWDHPNMPWDDTSVSISELTCNDDHIQAGPSRPIASAAAWQQARWSPSGRLHAVGDPDGWWNIFELDPAGLDHHAIAPMEAEFGLPSWAFGTRTYAWDNNGTLWATWVVAGDAHIGHLQDGSWIGLDCDYCEFDGIVAHDDGIAFLAAGPTQGLAVVAASIAEVVTEPLHRIDGVQVPADFVSIGQPFEFATDDDRIAHGFYYPPTNPNHELGSAPPMIVLSHGGPTGASTRALDLGIQYWTSRGFAVADVNYGGSTGYGTEYRNRLRGSWGITDTVDCVRAAEHLAQTGRAAHDQLVIKGGSAGGYTTLCALTYHDTFAAGISRYGVADLETLARDTHKFESRYLDLLVGPWPEDEATYKARSPIHHTERLSCPMIVLQGSDDPIVPVGQAEQMVDALRAAGLPYSYVLYEGESHGFRAAENIAHALESELSFLGQVLGFDPADDITAVEVHRPS